MGLYIPTERPVGRPREIEVNMPEAAALRAQGWSWASLAAKYGTSRGMMRYRLDVRRQEWEALERMRENVGESGTG